MRDYRLFILIFLGLNLCSCSKTTLGFFIDEPSDTRVPASYEFGLEESNCTEYEWDFGDGIISQDSTPNHTYYLSGNYIVTLKGTRGDKTKTVKKEIFVQAPEKCLVKIETSMGVMLAELYDTTPKHRDNFVKLTEEGFYNDLLFHRIISGFMVQGGDPNSKDADMSVQLGAGGPGYQIDAEITPKLAHTKGALAAARMGDQVNPERKSSGSQFYIVHGRSVDAKTVSQYESRLGINYPDDVKAKYIELGGVPFLDQQYTVFGQVIDGLEVIDKIAAVQTNGQDRPLESVAMKISLVK